MDLEKVLCTATKMEMIKDNNSWCVCMCGLRGGGGVQFKAPPPTHTHTKSKDTDKATERLFNQDWDKRKVDMNL